MNEPSFWNDQQSAKKISKQLSQIREEISHINKLDEVKGELETYQLLLEEDFNQALFEEAVAELPRIRSFIEKAEIECYLNDKYDQDRKSVV